MGHTNSKVVKAAKAGNARQLRRLVSKLSAERVRQIRDTPSNGLQTPLHWAADNGYLEVAEGLLAAGASPDAKDSINLTALHVAASKGHTAIVGALLSHGASLTAVDRRTRATPLHAAARKGHADVIAVLLKHGARVDAPDKVHRTPLHYAAARGHAGTVKLLIKHGADVNSQDHHKVTPLHLAAEFNVFTDTVEALIELGADVSAKDGWGRTPAFVASGLGFNDHVIRAAQSKIRRYSRTDCASTDADSDTESDDSSDADEASVGDLQAATVDLANPLGAAESVAHVHAPVHVQSMRVGPN